MVRSGNNCKGECLSVGTEVALEWPTFGVFKVAKFVFVYCCQGQFFRLHLFPYQFMSTLHDSLLWKYNTRLSVQRQLYPLTYHNLFLHFSMLKIFWMTCNPLSLWEVVWKSVALKNGSLQLVEDKKDLFIMYLLILQHPPISLSITCIVYIHFLNDPWPENYNLKSLYHQLFPAEFTSLG